MTSAKLIDTKKNGIRENLSSFPGQFSRTKKFFFPHHHRPAEFVFSSKNLKEQVKRKNDRQIEIETGLLFRRTSCWSVSPVSDLTRLSKEFHFKRGIKE